MLYLFTIKRIYIWFLPIEHETTEFNKLSYETKKWLYKEHLLTRHDWMSLDKLY